MTVEESYFIIHTFICASHYFILSISCFQLWIYLWLLHFFSPSLCFSHWSWFGICSPTSNVNLWKNILAQMTINLPCVQKEDWFCTWPHLYLKFSSLEQLPNSQHILSAVHCFSLWEIINLYRDCFPPSFC